MVDFIFTIFLLLIILIISLNLLNSTFSDDKQVEINLISRSLIDKVGNSINSVNSKNVGTIKEVTLPNNISSLPYSIAVRENEVIISILSRKGETSIHPVKLANIYGNIVNEIKLYPGESYKIKKSINSDNITVLQIYNYEKN